MREIQAELSGAAPCSFALDGGQADLSIGNPGLRFDFEGYGNSFSFKGR